MQFWVIFREDPFLKIFSVHTWYVDLNEVLDFCLFVFECRHCEYSLLLLYPKTIIRFLFNTDKSSSFFWYTGFSRICFHIKSMLSSLLLLRSRQSELRCHTWNWWTACSAVPCMILVLSYFLHDRWWCGFILCLTCTPRTKCVSFPQLCKPNPSEIESELIKASWRRSG